MSAVVLAISGSLRKPSFTEKMLDLCIEGMGPNLEVHTDWVWSGELLISAAGAANVPRLFDRKIELIRRAGAELVQNAVLQETSEELAAPVMPAEDYRRMATLSFEGGVVAKAKMIAIAMKTLRGRREPTRPNQPSGSSGGP